LKNRFLIPRDLEFETSEETNIEEKESFVAIPSLLPHRGKVVVCVATLAKYNVYK